MASLAVLLDMERGPGTDDRVPNPRKEHMKIEVTVKLKTTDYLYIFEDAEVYRDGGDLVVDEEGITTTFNYDFVVWYREMDVDQPVYLDTL